MALCSHSCLRSLEFSVPPFPLFLISLSSMRHLWGGTYSRWCFCKKADRWTLMDAKFGDLQGVVSVLGSMYPAWQKSATPAAPSEPLWQEQHAQNRQSLDLNSGICFSRALTLQSISTSFCFSFSLSKSNSFLLSLCQQCMTNEYKTPSGCIHPCVPIQLMMFILCCTYLSPPFFFYLLLIYLPFSLLLSCVKSARVNIHLAWPACLAHAYDWNISQIFLFLAHG